MIIPHSLHTAIFLLNLRLYYLVFFFLVGDPLGVRSCINYGDSFLQVSRIFNFTFHSLIYAADMFLFYQVWLIVSQIELSIFLTDYFFPYFQLKKVRLRTTFASMDTSGSGVKLSCCEHYENVMYAYSDPEITAVQQIITFIITMAQFWRCDDGDNGIEESVY